MNFIKNYFMIIVFGITLYGLVTLEIWSDRNIDENYRVENREIVSSHLY